MNILQEKYKIRCNKQQYHWNLSVQSSEDSLVRETSLTEINVSFTKNTSLRICIYKYCFMSSLVQQLTGS